MEWRQFVMNLESIEPARVEEVLLRHGAQSVTLTDAGDDPVLEPAPGETPLWAETQMTALFGVEADIDSLRTDLMHSLGLDALPENRVENLADRAWEREWLKDFRPMRFGERLWVVPGELEVEDDAAVIVRLDPGLAFGTGTHATTALCLDWLERIDVRDKSMLDFGCGSGILSIAALRLGAASVTAIDVDLQAVSATRQNARRNSVTHMLEAGTELPADTPRFGIVVANILAGTLIESAEFVCDRLIEGGMLALSGILTGQADEVMDAYRQHIDFATPVTRDDWALLSGTRI